MPNRKDEMKKSEAIRTIVKWWLNSSITYAECLAQLKTVGAHETANAVKVIKSEMDNSF